jgi:hypothetical protein
MYICTLQEKHSILTFNKNISNDEHAHLEIKLLCRAQEVSKYFNTLEEK